MLHSIARWLIPCKSEGFHELVSFWLHLILPRLLSYWRLHRLSIDNIHGSLEMTTQLLCIAFQQYWIVNRIFFSSVNIHQENPKTKIKKENNNKKIQEEKLFIGIKDNTEVGIRYLILQCWEFLVLGNPTLVYI